MYLFKNKFVYIYTYTNTRPLSAPQQLEPEELVHQSVTHISPAWKNLAAVDGFWWSPSPPHDRTDISAHLHDIKIIGKKKEGRLKGLSGYKWLSVRLILANKRSTVHELSSKHVNVVTLSPRRTAWRDRDAMSRVHECV